MAAKIYKLYLIKRYTEAYYQMAPEEWARYWKRIEQNEFSNGAQLLLSCTSRWSDEAFAGWGLIEYPDLQAVIKTTALNEAEGLFRYMETQTFLGTLSAGERIPILDTPEAIYQLWIIKNQSNEVWGSLAPDTRDRIFAGVGESIGKWSGQFGINCDVNWSSEEYNNYGVIAWPNIEAQQGHFEDLQKLDWHRYVYARTILGKRD